MGVAANGKRVNDTLCVSDIIITIITIITTRPKPACGRPSLANISLCTSSVQLGSDDFL